MKVAAVLTTLNLPLGIWHEYMSTLSDHVGVLSYLFGHNQTYNAYSATRSARNIQNVGLLKLLVSYRLIGRPSPSSKQNITC